VLLPASPSYAQSPPPSAAAPAPLPTPGFMPPYEVTRTVRAAGFEPLAPPLRVGATYVLRATDFRGILMRVVVDARSGAIRAANRIVSPTEPYGPIGMVAPPYGMPAPYGALPDADGVAMAPDEGALPPSPLAPGRGPPPRPSVHPAGPYPAVLAPPLPRPRPADLAARESKAAGKPVERPPVSPDAQPSATATAPPPPVSPPAASKRPPPPPINE